MKCEHENGMTVRIGDYEIDPCQYEEIERYENVTVSILKCKKCGHIEIEWVRQPNTRLVKE